MREVIISPEEIQKITKECASKLEKKFENSKEIPIFIGVLKGALPFMMDLMKYYSLPCKEDYVEISSYSGTSSTGVLHLKKDVTQDIENRDIVIIEDIVDTGLTLNYLSEYLKIKHKPRSITVCCFIDKKFARKIKFEADIVGYTLTENKFLVGYGLDYYEICRNINYVFIPTKEDLDERNSLLNIK